MNSGQKSEITSSNKSEITSSDHKSIISNDIYNHSKGKEEDVAIYDFKSLEPFYMEGDRLCINKERLKKHPPYYREQLFDDIKKFVIITWRGELIYAGNMQKGKFLDGQFYSFLLSLNKHEGWEINNIMNVITHRYKKNKKSIRGRTIIRYEEPSNSSILPYYSDFMHNQDKDNSHDEYIGSVIEKNHEKINENFKKKYGEPETNPGQNNIKIEKIKKLNIKNKKLIKENKDYSNYIEKLFAIVDYDTEEMEKNNFLINILRNLNINKFNHLKKHSEHIQILADKKNIVSKTEMNKSNKETNKSQLPVIKQKQVVNNKETKPKTNLPVINNKKYNNKYNLMSLINSGKIKGNNMDFFRPYNFKNWKEVRNRQIEQKNILPLINK